MVRLFLLMCLCLHLLACGDSDSPTASNNGDNLPADSNDPPDDTQNPPRDNNTPPDESGPPPPVDSDITRVVQSLRSPRDLIFGPAGSSLADEFFVVSFTGPEASWIQNFERDSQTLELVQDSLVGAIAVDIDAEGRFYFACLTPRMGDLEGVITVRTIGSDVPDFQYKGIDGPSGVALDSQGRLFVFNRLSANIVRIDFNDGATPDNHSFELIAERLQPGDEILPNHLLVDPDDRLFVCETGANRILSWNEEDGIATFATEAQGLDTPVGIARRSNGNIIVANFGDGLLVELDPQGALVQRIETDLGPARLQAVAVRANDQIYIAEDNGSQGNIYRIEP